MSSYNRLAWGGWAELASWRTMGATVLNIHQIWTFPRERELWLLFAWCWSDFKVCNSFFILMQCAVQCIVYVQYYLSLSETVSHSVVSLTLVNCLFLWLDNICQCSHTVSFYYRNWFFFKYFFLLFICFLNHFLILNSFRSLWFCRYFETLNFCINCIFRKLTFFLLLQNQIVFWLVCLFAICFIDFPNTWPRYFPQSLVIADNFFLCDNP